MIVSDELLPCPFCGAAPCKEVQNGTNTPAGQILRVWCERCDALGPEQYYEPDAIAAWNVRSASLKANRPPFAWAYEFHDFGAVWTRHVILNNPNGGANAPTKHNGSDIRNVQPLYTHPAAVNANCSKEVAVKALEWADHGTEWRAESPFGRYTVRKKYADWLLGGELQTFQQICSVGEAKAAAQQDFNDRVLSCLEETV